MVEQLSPLALAFCLHSVTLLRLQMQHAHVLSTNTRWFSKGFKAHATGAQAACSTHRGGVDGILAQEGSRAGHSCLPKSQGLLACVRLLCIIVHCDEIATFQMPISLWEALPTLLSPECISINSPPLLAIGIPEFWPITHQNVGRRGKETD